MQWQLDGGRLEQIHAEKAPVWTPFLLLYVLCRHYLIGLWLF